MIKKIKPVILILIHLLFLQGVCGQSSSDMTDYLSKKFLTYCKSVPREEIYIHTDREQYVSGEDIWFNVYLINRQSLTPSADSKIVYFEILNKENRPVAQKRISLDKGFGPGQIIIPDTLSTGNYTLRAYTSWMKNFLPYNCFIKNIFVYNALNTKSLTGVSQLNYTKNEEIRNSPSTLRTQGVGLKINNSMPDNLEIIVTSDNKFREENTSMYLFIQTHGNINYVSAVKPAGESTRIIIPGSKLDKGINQITVFNSKGEPVAERFIYTPSKRQSSVTLSSVDSAGLRGKIPLNISIGKLTPEELNSATFSISVAPLSEGTYFTDMSDYLIFGSEFGLNLPQGTEKSTQSIDSLLLNATSNWISWPAILSYDNEKFQFRYPVEKTDNYLSGKLQTGDQRSIISPESILMCIPGKEADFQYARTDNEGNFKFPVHIDEGFKDLIIMPDNGNKNRKINIESSFSDKYVQPESFEDSLKVIIPGIAKLSVNHQVQKIYGNSASGTVLNTAFHPLTPIRFYGKPDIELILADYIKLPVMNEIFFELLPGVSLRKKKAVAEISITYRIGDDQFTTSPCLMIDGVIISDATLIANLDPELVEKIDVIREKYMVGKYLFPGLINVITKAGDFNSVNLPDYMVRMPYRVIDPVKTFVSPDYSSEQLKDSRIPDYRNTLYWNPSVKPDKDGNARIEFWSSDNKSDYIINIQGITPNGEMFSIRKLLKIK